MSTVGVSEDRVTAFVVASMIASMKTILVLAVISSTCFAAGKIPVVQQTDTVKVVGVTDGDTVRVLRGTETIKVRLEGIDAPEAKQAFGNRSKQYLSDQVFGKEARLDTTGQDRYGRTLGKLYLGETDINLKMIEAGMAWHYDYFNAEESYAAAQREAKEAQRGLWSDAEQVTPWEFRKQKKVN